jgi:tRNA 2-thiocytidine biosynthesis protein TtcA
MSSLPVPPDTVRGVPPPADATVTVAMAPLPATAPVPSTVPTPTTVPTPIAAPTSFTAPIPVTAVRGPDTLRREQRSAFEGRKLEKRLIRLTGQAVTDYGMIENGDRVMVCLSGGKDSYAMLQMLRTLRARAPLSFELIAVNLDQKQPGFPEHVLPDYLREQGVPFHIETQDTYSIVKRLIPEGKTTCSLCSRLRRGVLYRVAGELGATKIALGHHRDDILGTFFLNLFYGGRIKAMPPKLVSDDGRHVVIRPLAYIPEDDLARYAQEQRFPIIPCNLCGSQENLKRKEIKQLIAEWERRFPGRTENCFNALAKVTPSHLMDRSLFDFLGLHPTGEPDPDGDTAFDDDSTANAQPRSPRLSRTQASDLPPLPPGEGGGEGAPTESRAISG